MNKENIELFDKLIDKINDIMKENKINDGVAFFPMLRKESDKLYIGTLIDIYNDDLIERNKVIRPEYWLVLDINDYHLIELNKTKDKDYMDSNIIPTDKEFDDKFKEENKELSKFSISKNIQYRDYLTKDIEKEIVNSQKNILDSINNTLIIDNEEVNATDYLNSMITDEIKLKVKELVDLIVNNKYSAIIYYYQLLFQEIIDEYKKNNTINNKKLILASKILDSYYGEYCGIKYFFNVE